MFVKSAWRLAVAGLGISLFAQAQVPDAVKNPFEGDRTAIEAGRQLYSSVCQACHHRWNVRTVMPKIAAISGCVFSPRSYAAKARRRVSADAIAMQYTSDHRPSERHSFCKML